MIRRRLTERIESSLGRSPVVVLVGPRQVGKTTLARAIAASRGSAAVYLDLERPADRRRLDDADSYLRTLQGTLVIIDEMHRAPNLFATLRGIIDDRRAAGDRVGHFLLLGSASIELMRQASETLAGRIESIELMPIDALELTPETGDVQRLWVRGGFPDSLLAADDAASAAWRHAFIRSYLERDVPMFAPRLPVETLGRLWTMLAHAHGAVLDQSALAAGLATSVPTVGRYVDLLVDLLLVRRLRPWSGHVGKRVVRRPKTYIRDSGLTHALLDLETWHDIVGHPIAGASWEGLVIDNLIAAAGERRTPYFYRTVNGAEIDLLFERGGVVEMAIEIKRSTAPTLSKGFRLANESLQPKAAYLVYPGTETWPTQNGVTTIPLTDLMRRLAET